MADLRDATLQRWWPTTQSLDLVRGDTRTVANAVAAEVSRFAGGERFAVSWESFGSLDAVFASIKVFANFPTDFVVMPTRSPWSVLWNNSFLCDGYDSLCWNLTANHALATLHWSAHDKTTTFQPGSRFIHRTKHDNVVVERAVHVSSQDGVWHFDASGAPLPEEHLDAYLAPRKRDRLNEVELSNFLDRCGARPWREEFYAIPEQSCCVINRPNIPSTVTVREPREVIPRLAAE